MIGLVAVLTGVALIVVGASVVVIAQLLGLGYDVDVPGRYNANLYVVLTTLGVAVAVLGTTAAVVGALRSIRR